MDYEMIVRCDGCHEGDAAVCRICIRNYRRQRRKNDAPGTSPRQKDTPVSDRYYNKMLAFTRSLPSA